MHKLKKSEYNAAAMREALELMNDLFDKGVICTSYANTPEEMEQIEKLYRKAKSALSKPPRQCDIGTEDEQAERFVKHCQSFLNRDGIKACMGCPCCGVVMYGKCELAWAQMPYEEGGAK